MAVSKRTVQNRFRALMMLSKREGTECHAFVLRYALPFARQCSKRCGFCEQSQACYLRPRRSPHNMDWSMWYQFVKRLACLLTPDGVGLIRVLIEKRTWMWAPLQLSGGIEWLDLILSTNTSLCKSRHIMARDHASGIDARMSSRSIQEMPPTCVQVGISDLHGIVF